jgi:uncharacterized protein
MPDEDRNPFEFGRELTSRELVDREPGLEEVIRVLEEGRRLFVIGPRRYGKTSILRVACDMARDRGMVVLRYDAERYPALLHLAQAILADATGMLVPFSERVLHRLRDVLSALRPEVSFNPMTNAYSVTLGSDSPVADDGPDILARALDAVESMAAEAGRPVGVVIDEFQDIVEHGGIAAEKQLRAAIQRHEHIGYVFAGSRTAMLTEMTGDPGRPFYRLGERLFVGEIPRAQFAAFLREAFGQTRFRIKDEAVDAILDLAEEVPYNVQRLAHACWIAAREQGRRRAVDAALVSGALDRLIRRDDPFYTQTWNQFTASQQRALLALATHGSEGLYGKQVLQETGLALSTMRRSVEALLRTSVVREEEKKGSTRLRLEDPFLGTWIRTFIRLS